MASNNVQSACGYSFVEAGGFDGPVTIVSIVLQAAGTAGTFTFRGTNSATGPVMLSYYLAANTGASVYLDRRCFPGIYLSALPSSGTAQVVTA